jgi:hypothetical protein
MKFFALSLLVVGSQAFAALPPYWDSARQIETAMSLTDDVAARMAGPIVSVTKTAPLTYKVVTESCSATVTLDVKPSMVIGPAEYEVSGVTGFSCR